MEEKSKTTAKNFVDLIVWRKAHDLVLKTYKITAAFPSDEKYGLVSQMRRASVSVPANIVEGYKKRGPKDKANFYNIADASLEELKYYFILSRDLGYINDTGGLGSLADEVGRLLYALRESLNP